jgi:Tfp pilus assembly protein PilO
MKASTKRILSIFGSLAGLFAVLVLLTNNILPGWRRVAALRKEIDEKQAVRERLEKLISQARLYLSRQEELESQARLINSSLPSSPNIPELIAVLNTLAVSNQVLMARLQFELEPFKEQPGSSAKGEEALPQVSRVVMRTNIVGTYPNIKAWLRSVESELRLLDVHILNLQSTVGEGTPAANTPINVEAALTAYWQQ